jgi:3-hydroxybutyrate dehydrogenase
MVYEPRMELRGKVALVTGGGRGIGAAVARRLAAAGLQVAICGRTEGEIEEVAASVGGVAVCADLGDRSSTDAMLAKVASKSGRIDVLVNNAGVAASAPLGRTRDETWDQVMEVNATAAFRITRALVPAMVEAGWGRIINIASNAGVSGYGYTVAYCAAKHAMVGMTRALAVDLARTGVTVNAICPGWVETRMAEDAVQRISDKTGRTPEEARSALAEMSPQGRIIAPEEVAHLVATLCADEARGVNGQAIVIDGGQVLK